METERLHPTLWRTCRALANRRRLAILQCLGKQGPLTVSQVAEQFALSPSTASQYLRALNARGLLTVQRRRRYVSYSVGADPSLPHAAELLQAVTRTLQAKPYVPARVMKAITGLTHPRRVHILRLLGRNSMTIHDLKTATGASAAALYRHVDKLARRGYVRRKQTLLFCGHPVDGLRKTLLRIAAQDPRNA